MPPVEYVTKELFEERHQWMKQWLQDVTEGFKDLRNDVLASNRKLDQLLSIEKREEKGRDAARKAWLLLATKVLGSGGAGAALLYIIQKLSGQ
jgi:hypothetical protein